MLQTTRQTLGVIPTWAYWSRRRVCQHPRIRGINVAVVSGSVVAAMCSAWQLGFDLGASCLPNIGGGLLGGIMVVLFLGIHERWLRARLD